MRKRSLAKLAAMLKPRSRYDSAPPPVDMKPNVRKAQAVARYYNARDVEFYFDGKRMDLDDRSFVEIDTRRREPSEPQYMTATATLTMHADAFKRIDR